MFAVIPLGLVVLMFGVGLETRLADFRAVVRAPRGVGLGLLLQIGVLPLLAFGLARFVGLPPVHVVGLVLLAATPGGVTANFLTLMAEGDVALSVSLTVIESLAAPLTLPIVAAAAFAGETGTAVAVALPVGKTIAAVVATTVAPLLVGLAVAERRAALAGRLRPAVRRISGLVFAGIVAAALVAEWPALVASWREVGLAVALLSLSIAGLTIVAARHAGIASPGRAALAITGTLRNVALALTVAIGLLGRPELAVAATVYVFAMNAVALAVVALRRRELVVRQGTAGAAVLE